MHLKNRPFFSVSPAKFQYLNRVAVNYLNKHGFMVYLYLDDRIEHSQVNRKLQKGETTKGAYLLACLLTAFGGFLSLDKSEWIPTQVMDFLGLRIDSRDLSLSVPQEKYEKCMAGSFTKLDLWI